jgi:hypothetical protein
MVTSAAPFAGARNFCEGGFVAPNRTRLIAQLVTAALLAAGARSAEAGPFTITEVASTADVFSAFNAGPSLNNVGTLAFFGQLDGGGKGIFSGGGGAITTIDEATHISIGFSSFVSINDSGTVAYVRIFGGQEVYTGDGGSTILMASSFKQVGEVSIDNSGTVAFPSIPFSTATQFRDVFTSDGMGLTSIADTSGEFAAFSQGAVINNDGTVAFRASRDSGNPGIFVGSAGSTSPVYLQGSGFTFLGQPEINDDGTLAFFGSMGGLSGVFTGNGGPTTTIADTDGAFSSFTPLSVGINNAGRVAFQATLDSGGSGIFVGPDPINDVVISVGDLLFGSTVTELRLFHQGFNDAGQIAFIAGLEDGRQIMARADPLVVNASEPTTLVLFAAGLAALGASRVRRRSGGIP